LLRSIVQRYPKSGAACSCVDGQLGGARAPKQIFEDPQEERTRQFLSQILH